MSIRPEVLLFHIEQNFGTFFRRRYRRRAIMHRLFKVDRAENLNNWRNGPQWRSHPSQRGKRTIPGLIQINVSGLVNSSDRRHSGIDRRFPHAIPDGVGRASNR